MKLAKKCTAASVLLASLASSFSGAVSTSAMAKPKGKKTSFFGKFGKLVSNITGTKNSTRAALGGLAAVGGLGYLSNKYVYVEGVPRLTDSSGLVDVPGTARYMSQMYVSDPSKFADRLRSVEFYKMYNAYKYGFVPFKSMVGMGEKKEDEEYKRALHGEMEKRIRMREPSNFLRQHIVGEGASNAIETSNSFLFACINFDNRPGKGKGIKGESVPVMALTGSGGQGKSFLTELLNKYMTGNDKVIDLNMVNKDVKDVNMDFHGIGPSYKDAAKSSAVLDALKNPNTCYQIIRIDEFDKIKKDAVGTLLQPFNDGVTLNDTDKYTYRITNPYVLTGNFEDHKFVSGWNRFWTGDDKKALNSYYTKDMGKFGGDPLTSRIRFVSSYGEPLYEDKLKLISVMLDKTKTSEKLPRFYVDNNLTKKEKYKIYATILDLIEKAKGGKDSMRDINNLTVDETTKIVQTYYPRVTTFSGRRVDLSLNNRGEVIATLH